MKDRGKAESTDHSSISTLFVRSGLDKLSLEPGTTAKYGDSMVNSFLVAAEWISKWD